MSDNHTQEQIVITFMSGADDGKQAMFEQPPITIGRLSTHLLSIPNDTFVSRSHAKIDRDERGYFLEDRQSRNGTYLCDQKISGSAALVSGDLFRVGDTWLKFEILRR